MRRRTGWQMLPRARSTETWTENPTMFTNLFLLICYVSFGSSLMKMIKIFKLRLAYCCSLLLFKTFVWYKLSVLDTSSIQRAIVLYFIRLAISFIFNYFPCFPIRCFKRNEVFYSIYLKVNYHRTAVIAPISHVWVCDVM